jgi:hypothetical protein
MNIPTEYLTFFILFYFIYLFFSCHTPTKERGDDELNKLAEAE